MTDYPYEGQLLVDPVTLQRAANGQIFVYDAGDTANGTPLALKDTTGLPLANPLTSSADAFTRPFYAPSQDIKLVGAGLTVFASSAKGMRDAAAASAAAAQTAANSASTAAGNTVASASVNGAGELVIQQASGNNLNAGPVKGAKGDKGDKGDKGADGANVLPTDDAIKQAINDTASATRGALNATYAPISTTIPKWVTATAYTAGQQVISPAGDIVSAISSHTSGVNFNAANWNTSSTYERGVSVITFGAKGDGVTDDTAAITAARSAMSPGAILWFPPHRTYLHTGLATGQTNETWEIGVGSTLKLANSANTHCITVTHSGFTLHGGGTIDGNRANQSVSSWYGVFISGADDATVRDVALKNIVNRGIYSRDSNRTIIDRCKVSLCGENGILIEATSGKALPIYDSVVRNCVVDRTAEGNTLAEGGIKVHGNGYGNYRTRITGNTVRLPDMASTGGAQIGIEVHSKSDKCVVSGNTTTGGTMGVSVDSSASVVVSANNLNRFSYYGIEWAASPEGVCTGNVLDGESIGLNGIVQSAAGSHRTAITGNVIKNITQDGITINGGNSSAIGNNIISMPAGSRWAINVSGGAYYCTITGNGIDSANANYSINVQPTAHITIQGNTLNGNSVALKAIAIDRSTNISIMGNVMRNYTQHGVLIYAQSTSAFTLDEITVLGNTFSSVGTTFAFAISNAGAIGTNILLGQARYGVTIPSFTTATRPSASLAGVGAQINDKTLSKPLTSDGTVWRDAMGTSV